MVIRSFFSSYLSKKGENVATQEDIQKLMDQVRETERVKSEISDRMWDRQAKWTIRRQHYQDLISKLAYEQIDCFLMVSTFSPNSEVWLQNRAVFREKHLGRTLETFTVTLKAARLFMPDNCYAAFVKFRKLTARFTDLIESTTPDLSKMEACSEEMKQSLDDLITILRSDLDL